MYPKTSKPFTRWWWFSGEIKEADIRCQLDWLKANGFGGVEIAWVYPLQDSLPTPEWLSEEWSSMAAYAKKHATEIGMGCDFTIGSLWPLGGSIVSEKDAARVYDGLSPQRLTWSWEDAHLGKPLNILNHLDRKTVEKYLGKIITALSPALKISESALFLDSWEVDTEQMWTEGFADAFEEKYEHPITPYMNDLDDYPDIRYDYRKLIGEYVLHNFYRTFRKMCAERGVVSRVQCHGAPTDLLAAYSLADVPETEAMLFEPGFAKIAASAATLSGKKVVSSETFSCIHGWEPRPGPGPCIKQERIADLKMVADALFANGVNHIVWHGMPYNPEGGSNEFYATTHVGPDSPFAEDIPAFNRYMETVCDVMRRGRTYSDIAVYFPLEDSRMLNRLTDPHHHQSCATTDRDFEDPGELLPPNAKYHWEMRYACLPEELKGYHPLWISTYHLREAQFENGLLRCGDASFSSLYVDVEWLDNDALNELVRLTEEGLPICLAQQPQQPGEIRTEAYKKKLGRLLSLPGVSFNVHSTTVNPPLVDGEDLPDFWCRVDGDEYHIFFANPRARDLHYPLMPGQSYSEETTEIPVTINAFSRKFSIDLGFEPYMSILLTVTSAGNVRFTELEFTPTPPVGGE